MYVHVYLKDSQRCTHQVENAPKVPRGIKAAKQKNSVFSVVASDAAVAVLFDREASHDSPHSPLSPLK